MTEPSTPQPSHSSQPPKRRRGLVVTLVAVAAFFGVIVGSGISSNSNSSGGNSGAAVSAASSTAPSAAAAASSSPSPSGPAITKQRSYVVFRVWGHSPGGADITYGSDSDSRSPAGGLGFDGQGTAVPWHGQVRYRAAAAFWTLSAQLQGSGDIHCAVLAKVVTWFADGTHRAQVKTIGVGHASGSYNVCDAGSS